MRCCYHPRTKYDERLYFQFVCPPGGRGYPYWLVPGLWSQVLPQGRAVFPSHIPGSLLGEGVPQSGYKTGVPPPLLSPYLVPCPSHPPPSPLSPPGQNQDRVSLPLSPHTGPRIGYGAGGRYPSCVFAQEAFLVLQVLLKILFTVITKGSNIFHTDTWSETLILTGTLIVESCCWFTWSRTVHFYPSRFKVTTRPHIRNWYFISVLSGDQ